MKKKQGFSLLEVLIAFALMTCITLTILRQQWYLQKTVLQLITAHEQLVIQENQADENFIA